MSEANLLKAIGYNIQRARRELGMKGDTLAKELKISKSAISQMENGSMDFRISVLHKIARILETDVCNLLTVSPIKLTEQLNNELNKEEHILIQKKVIDELINQMQNIKKLQTASALP